MPDACCSVGARSDAAAIDAALRSGDPENSFRKLAARHGLSVGALQRHKTHLAGPPATDTPADTAANTPDTRDTATSEALSVQPARPPRPVAPAASCDVTFESRVNHIADLIAAGDYDGRPTASRLAREWRIGRGAVQNYMRAAALLVRGDAGEREELRQTSIARWQKLYKDARDAGDLNAATKAQAGWDRAAGVVEPGGARVNIQIGDHDFGRGTMQFMMVGAPQLAQDYAAWCQAVQAGDQVARNDPGKWLMARKDVVDTTGEAAE